MKDLINIYIMCKLQYALHELLEGESPQGF